MYSFLHLKLIYYIYLFSQPAQTYDILEMKHKEQNQSITTARYQTNGTAMGVKKVQIIPARADTVPVPSGDTNVGLQVGATNNQRSTTGSGHQRTASASGNTSELGTSDQKRAALGGDNANHQRVSAASRHQRTISSTNNDAHVTPHGSDQKVAAPSTGHSHHQRSASVSADGKENAQPQSNVRPISPHPQSLPNTMTSAGSNVSTPANNSAATFAKPQAPTLQQKLSAGQTHNW